MENEENEDEKQNGFMDSHGSDLENLSIRPASGSLRSPGQVLKVAQIIMNCDQKSV